MKNLSVIAVIAMMIAGCSTSTQSSSEETVADAAEIATTISFTKAPASPSYPDATLTKNDL